MNKPSGGLGRGLGSLLPKTPPARIQNNAESAGSVSGDAGLNEIAIDAIVANPHQPRKEFRQQELDDLVASIKEFGILQPLVVTKKDDGNFELIAGERRLRASKIAGLKKVPVVIRTADEQEKLELAIIENIQRHDLNAFEEATAYRALMDQFSLTQEQAAKRVGKSRSYVANTLRLLDLEEEMLQALMNGDISRSHARTLLQEKNEERRKELFDQIKGGGISVREMEEKVQQSDSGNVRKVKKDPNILAIEKELREALGTKVSLSMKGSGGKLTVHFYSKDDLKGIVDRLVE